MIHGPPDCDFKAFKTFVKDIYSISLKSNKLFYATKDFKLNVLDYNKNEKLMKFLNLTFGFTLVPVLTNQLDLQKNTVTAIDHIITNPIKHSNKHRNN